MQLFNLITLMAKRYLHFQNLCFIFKVDAKFIHADRWYIITKLEMETEGDVKVTYVTVSPLSVT